MKHLFAPRKSHTVWLILLYYLYIFIFQFPFAFNSETDNNSSYGLYLSGIVLLVLANALLLFNARSASGSNLLFFIGAVLVLVFQVLAYRRYGPPNEFFTSITVLFAIYICLRMTISAADILIVTCLLLGFLLIQLILAAQQFAESIPSEWGTSVKGSLQNSGAFACYVVVHIPLLFYALKRLPAANALKVTIAAIFLLLIGMVLFLTQSRTAIISCFVSIAVILLLEYQQPIRQVVKRSKPLVIGALVIAGIGLYCGMHYLLQFKKLSVSGRSLMLKVAEKHMYDHFWLGTGIGRFTWYYPQWQADYFRTTANPPMDIYLSAGKAYVIFNEYLQLFEEVGIIGLLLFLFLLFDFFRSRSATHQQLLNYLKITVIAILACGFTSYPFHIHAILLIMVLCFAAAYAIRDKRQSPKWLDADPRIKRVVLCGSLLCLAYAGMIAIKQNLAISQWTTLRTNEEMSREEKLGKFAVLYDQLKYDGKFLVEYGQFLSHDPKDCAHAVNVLEESKQYFLSYLSYSAAAVACQCAGKYTEAIGNYEFLAAYVPNRFRPKYEMARLYLATGDTATARQMASQILNMPVKVPSAEVDKIRKDMQQLLTPIF